MSGAVPGSCSNPAEGWEIPLLTFPIPRGCFSRGMKGPGAGWVHPKPPEKERRKRIGKIQPFRIKVRNSQHTPKKLSRGDGEGFAALREGGAGSGCGSEDAAPSPQLGRAGICQEI